MPMVALLVVVFIAGGGVALLLASRAKSGPPRGRISRRRRRAEPEDDDPDPYPAWQVSEWAGRDGVALATQVFNSDTQDDACRAEPGSAFNYDLERDDPPRFEVERDDSCSSDSGVDSGGDSSSSD